MNLIRFFRSVYEISQQTFVLIKTSWRCISSSSSEDVCKTSWLRGMCLPWSYIRLQKMPSRHLQDVFIKTNIFVLVICLAMTSSRRLQNIFNTSCKNVFKTSSGCLSKMSTRYLQGIFKISSRSLQGVFITFLRYTAETICIGQTSEEFLVRLKVFREWTLWIYWNLWKCFFKTLAEATASTNKDILVKVGYQKRCCCLSK